MTRSNGCDWQRRKTSLSFRASPAADDRAGRPRAEPSLQRVESRFFKILLSREVTLGMIWTWHQLAPAMPGQKIVDRAVAGFVPDRLFIGHLEIVDVQHLARPRSLGKARQQGLLFGQRHVLA